MTISAQLMADGNEAKALGTDAYSCRVNLKNNGSAVIWIYSTIDPGFANLTGPERAALAVAAGLPLAANGGGMQLDNPAGSTDLRTYFAACANGQQSDLRILA